MTTTKLLGNVRNLILHTLNINALHYKCKML